MSSPEEASSEESAAVRPDPDTCADQIDPALLEPVADQEGPRAELVAEGLALALMRLQETLEPPGDLAPPTVD